jgi:hypothetical protein
MGARPKVNDIQSLKLTEIRSVYVVVVFTVVEEERIPAMFSVMSGNVFHEKGSEMIPTTDREGVVLF